MNIYRIEEYTKEKYEDLTFDKVIVLELLRSNMYICQNRDEITVSQQPHTISYDNKEIELIEERELEQELTLTRNFVRNHYGDFINNNPILNIISRDTNNLNMAKKYSIGKIEYAKEKKKEELKKERDLTIKTLEHAHISASEYDSYCDMLGVRPLEKDIEVIRFYVKSKNVEEDYIKVDIKIDKEKIREVILNKEINDYEPFKYFINKYFSLIKENAPLEDIMAIDNGHILNYYPSIYKKYLN